MTKSTKSRIPAIGLVLAVGAFLVAIAFLVFGAPRGVVGFRTAFETLQILGWLGVLGAAGSLVILVIGGRTGFPEPFRLQLRYPLRYRSPF